MSKILVIIGTRPEAIKMAPVIMELKKRKLQHIVVSTGQHREMLREMLKVFKIKPDYDLDIMSREQSLFDITIKVLAKIRSVYENEKPSLVLVQGDTLSSFISGLAAFYQKIPIGHVEAGLRTYNKYYPFPEEISRELIDILADYYFTPTELTKQNLLREGKSRDKIYVTGNTVVDALLTIDKEKKRLFNNPSLNRLDFSKKIILVETHRREIWGNVMGKIHKALRIIAEKNQDIVIVFLVHKNPIVRKSAESYLKNHPRIILVESLDYFDLIKVLKICYFIITDSGGLQEEAPTFGKPVLIVRRETERLEGINSGIAKLIGLDSKHLIKQAEFLIRDKNQYRVMSSKHNPYGDGKAAQRIVNIIARKIIHL
ncbi:MAG: UDP-N-acetylglucosamine 2-epimerase [Parcubacteria group bacterium GW2011_GWA1_36_12]|nr:MAG: UDP-N-acetylglucosamine 2-epimerase [Parcubacteria group bacterium GW2011_GWA1_36_12]